MVLKSPTSPIGYTDTAMSLVSIHMCIQDTNLYSRSAMGQTQDVNEVY